MVLLFYFFLYMNFIKSKAEQIINRLKCKQKKPYAIKYVNLRSFIPSAMPSEIILFFFLLLIHTSFRCVYTV